MNLLKAMNKNIMKYCFILKLYTTSENVSFLFVSNLWFTYKQNVAFILKS